MKLIEKSSDLSIEEIHLIQKTGYLCIDTETTGLDYMNDMLCTIQLHCDGVSIIIRYNSDIIYKNLKAVLMSDEIIKIFHNAVFDVSFLMKNLEMDSFGKLVCTKIASKILNGLDFHNSLKKLLKVYLDIEINKNEQLSNWFSRELSDSQKNYAINDVKYLYPLWNALYEQLIKQGLEKIAFACFEFIPSYKLLTDRKIDNIFKY